MPRPTAIWGVALLQMEKSDEAIVHFQKALEVRPDDAKCHNDLGNALMRKGRTDEAMIQYQKALAIQPDFDLALFNYGCALLQKGESDRAIAHFQKALAIQPDFAEAHITLAGALLQKGQVREVLAHSRTALKLQPDNPAILSSLAWVLATWPEASVRNGAEAIELGQRAKQLTGGQDPLVLRALAAAYAETGRFAEAIMSAQQAMELALRQNDPGLVVALRSELNFYRAGSPFREPASLPGQPR